jgi:TolB-like protein/DNA-binding winged helix-turn-helix (wHTH) protein
LVLLMENAVPVRVQVGSFECDLKAGELRKDARKVRLQEQPFQILLMLIQSPGKLVTREEIREKLWPVGTVVEFEHSINTAIKKLRQALDDSADNPTYIETVGRRGYRLVASLECLPPEPGHWDSPQPDRPASEVHGYGECGFGDSIAVLPFENPYPEMEYLSDGIAETITNRLSEIAGLRVVPRSVAFRYKDKGGEPARLCNELDARLLLTGHIVQQRENLIVGAELIDTVRESHLWGQTYQRKLDDIFSIQEEIGKAVSNHLQFRLTDSERSRLSKRGTENREAYLLYVKALYWANKWTKEALQKSFQYTQQAIEADPAYAEAYIVLAYMFAVMGYFEYAPPAEMFSRSRAAAQRALEIDDTLANAHAALAFMRLVFDRDFAAAEYEARRAIELGPQLTAPHYVYSHWCLTQCRFEDAIIGAKRALELDPLALVKSFHLGSIYLYSRRYDDAIEHLKQTLEIDQSFWMIHVILALAYARKGMHREAMAVADRCPNDVTSRATQGIINAISGRPDEARLALNELRRDLSVSPRMKCRIAGIHAELGEIDDAFECLNQALEARVAHIVYLRADPSFDNLHGDARWLDLLRRIGLVSN